MTRTVGTLLAVVLAVVLAGTLGPCGAAAEGAGYSVDERGAFYLPDASTVNDDLFAAGSSVTVRGGVTGDLMAAGNSVMPSGAVGGDALLAGRTVAVSGQVAGDVRAVGQLVNLDCWVEKNVTAFGESIVLGKNGRVGRNLLGGGRSLEVTGVVGGNARLHGEDIVISGRIGGDVIAEGGNLTVLDGAEVLGNIQFKGPRPPVVASGSRVSGRVDYEPVAAREEHQADPLDRYVFPFVNLTVLTVLLALFAPGAVNRVVEEARRKPVLGAGIAFLWLTVTPIVAVLLAVSVVGRSTALTAGVAYLSALASVAVIGKAVFSIAIGRLIAAKLNPAMASWQSAIAGAVVVYILGLIPVAGFLVNALAGVIILGTILRVLAAGIFTWPFGAGRPA